MIFEIGNIEEHPFIRFFFLCFAKMMSSTVLCPIDEVIRNVNKVSSEMKGSEVIDGDFTMANGEEDTNDVVMLNGNANEACIIANDKSNETENMDVADILDFIDNISVEVQKAMVGDATAAPSDTVSQLNENVTLTNMLDSVQQPSCAAKQSDGAAGEKCTENDKIVVDDDNVEIIDDGIASEADIVDITSDDDEKLLKSPSGTTAVQPIADAVISLNDSNDADSKTGEQEGEAVGEEVVIKKNTVAAEASPIVIDIDDDDDDEAVESTQPGAAKKDCGLLAGGDQEEIKTIDLDDDDDVENENKSDETTRQKDAENTIAPQTVEDRSEPNGSAAEVCGVTKPVESPKPKEIDSMSDHADAVPAVVPVDCTDSTDSTLQELPAAEIPSEKEMEIIAAIDQDIDQGNNLLEEMADVPISNGGSSDASSSANEDEDMDPNHFASDDIILLPYDDEASKSSACSETAKAVPSTPVNIKASASLTTQASIEVIDSAESTTFKEVEETVEQNDAITSTDATTANGEAPTESPALTSSVSDDVKPDGEDSLSSSRVKNKLDSTEREEVQPEAKKQRVDSLFDVLKEATAEDPDQDQPKDATESVKLADIVAPQEISEKSVSKVDEALGVSPSTAAAVDGDVGEIGVISAGTKRSAEEIHIEEPAKKLKIADESMADDVVVVETVIETTAETSQTSAAKQIVPAEVSKVTLSPEPAKPEQKQTLAMGFLKKFKKQFDEMTKRDLEDLVMEKIVEAIVHKSEYSELRNKAEAQEQIIQSFRVKVQELTKQYRDLEMVHARVVKDLEARNQTIVNPIKITRAVGLQVCLMKKDIASATNQTSASTSPAQARPSSNQVTKGELARRAALVMQQQKMQKVQRQAELNKQKQELQEELAKKAKLAQMKPTEANKNVRILHNQQLRMKAQSQAHQSQQGKMLHLLPRATTITVATTPSLRKSLPTNPPQLT